MTDLEMTRLCAEAMGITYRVSHDRRSGEFVEINTGRDPGNEGEYDPLHDDAQAMALVKKFRLDIAFLFSPEPTKGRWAVRGTPDGWEISRQRDLNHAIVECVARIQEDKQ